MTYLSLLRNYDKENKREVQSNVFDWNANIIILSHIINLSYD